MMPRSSQNGSALVYILIAIALVAAITATFMDNSGQQVSSQNTFNVATDLKSQIDFIRSGIQECVLTYPDGDKTTAYAALTATNQPYPLNPKDNYLVDPSADNQVSSLRCPGNPGDSNDHAAIFGGASGKFLPPSPKLFTKWYYQNNADGVFIVTLTDKTDAYLKTALAKLDEQFTECEADIIDATGGQEFLVSDNSDWCPAGYVCFRVWSVINPTAVYNGDVDGDEAACP